MVPLDKDSVGVLFAVTLSVFVIVSLAVTLMVAIESFNPRNLRAL